MSVLEIIIALPLLAALAVWLGAPARAASLGATFVNLALVLYATVQYAAKPAGLAFTNARVVLENPAISFAVGADGVSLILALLTSLVMLAAVWQIEDRPNIFYISSLLIGGGAMGAFLTTDVFFIYAFHELALIPTFLMIALHGRADPAVRKGRRLESHDLSWCGQFGTPRRSRLGRAGVQRRFQAHL
jgi:NADH-quinone oxidoreductase subunit M